MERPPEVIEPGCLYTKSEVTARLRLGEKTWKKLVDAGLPVIHIGKGAFVFTDDLFSVMREIHGTAAQTRE